MGVHREVMLFLVHHADAVGPEIDSQRPLSSQGHAHAERLARDAAARGVKPVTIWHSGKLRAKQTAECFWRACNPLAEFAAIPGLRPDDPPTDIEARLAAESRDVMLVGHMPSLPRLLQALLGTTASKEPVGFPQHALVALEREGQRWVERWRIE